MAQPQNKRSFEFRMSKKVAELTQVVHMLFTRNHEKEVEIEAIKDSYEHEIELVIDDAKNKIRHLEVKVQELQQQQEEEGTRRKHMVENTLKERETEWKTQVASMESQLADEKRECQNARDLLIQAQKDIENLRQGQTTEASKWTRDLDSKDKEVERLNMLIHTLEKRLKDAESQSNGALAELQRSYSKQQKELFVVREECQDSEKQREQLLAKNRQLEAEIRILKKELSKKDKQSRNSAKPEYDEVHNAAFLDYAEEIEKLRREVARYRNELSNREGNFNRVFSDQKPIFVDRRAGKMAMSTDAPVLRYNRDRTHISASFNGTPIGPAIALSQSRSGISASEEDLRELIAVRTPVRSASSNSSNGRLPHLGMDRLHRGPSAPRLAKPKPLPREMLSAKAGAH